MNKKIFHPLMEDNFSNDDIQKVINFLNNHFKYLINFNEINQIVTLCKSIGFHQLKFQVQLLVLSLIPELI